MKVKKTVFQLFVVLLALTILSTFSMAKSHKKYDHKKYKKLEWAFKAKKEQIKALSEILADLQAQIDNIAAGNPGGQTDDTAVNELKEQVDALSEDLDALIADLKGQIDEIAANSQRGNDAGPRFMCPGCIFPSGALPEDVKARLEGAYLPNAYFAGTIVTGVDLSGADLSQAIWFSTTCPDGTNSDDWWYTCEGHLKPLEE